MMAHLQRLSMQSIRMYGMATAIPFNSVNVLHCLPLVEHFCAEVELHAL